MSSPPPDSLWLKKRTTNMGQRGEYIWFCCSNIWKFREFFLTLHRVKCTWMFRLSYCTIIGADEDCLSRQSFFLYILEKDKTSTENKKKALKLCKLCNYAIMQLGHLGFSKSRVVIGMRKNGLQSRYKWIIYNNYTYNIYIIYNIYLIKLLPKKI